MPRTFIMVESLQLLRHHVTSRFLYLDISPENLELLMQIAIIWINYYYNHIVLISLLYEYYT